jgi:hypothetical protein
MRLLRHYVPRNDLQAFDFPFPFNLSSFPWFSSPFGLSSTGRLGRIKRGACLSEASSPRPVQTEARRAAEGQHMGRFFFGSVSFVRTKEMNSPMKGEKHSLIQAKE